MIHIPFLNIPSGVFTTLICLGMMPYGLSAQPKPVPGKSDSFLIYASPNPWVEARLAEMSQKEKIGQLFMVGVFSERGSSHEAYIERLVREYHIGGLIFMKGSARKQLTLTRRYQEAARHPLLIAMDAEWGPAMRLKAVPSWPRQMTLGAQPDPGLTRAMGQAMARQLKALGVHVNFAPVVDINSNPQNPVIHTRSFGGDKVLVSMHGKALMEGLQKEKVLSVAKHFPGHGDTEVDSHFDLPLIDKDYSSLFQTELYPFRQLCDAGVGGVMSAHLHLPFLDERTNRAASLSRKIVEGLLRDSMAYQGLIFSDALNMKGVSQYFGRGEVAVEAFKAGNDVLLYPEDVPAGVEMIEAALEKGDLSMARLNASVRRILQAKAWAGLDTLRYPEPSREVLLDSLLWNPDFTALKNTLIDKAITVPLDPGKRIPVPTGYPGKIVSVAINASADNAFQQRLAAYLPAHFTAISRYAEADALNAARAQLENADLRIVSLHGLSRYDVKQFGLPDHLRRFLQSLPHKDKTILVVFGSPYALRDLPGFGSIMLAYEPGSAFEDMAAQALCGARPIQGKLPVTVNDRFQLLQGERFSQRWRLAYGIPEEVGMDGHTLMAIDTIAHEALDDEATPGCQVLVARNNTIIYRKNFGYHTYEKQLPVEDTSIYDLASITKIASTMLPVMRFYELGLFSPESTLGESMPRLQNTNKSKLYWREVLAHQSGLQAWIPFYRYTLNDAGLADSNYCYAPNSFFQLEVAEGIYTHPQIRDTIFRHIDQSALKTRGEYLYSDLGFIYLKQWAERKLRIPIEEYVRREFYLKMGMQRTAFRPLEHFAQPTIVPTEYDDYFRHQLIHGHVHDQAAAMLGGVAGHAGLFSSATDMAVLMQMLLNGGQYGGHRFYMPSTLRAFTRQQFKGNRKGMGFDKPEMDPEKVSPAAPSASGEAFGHTGFTGTCAWADPRDELIFIFLSNRVHPKANNHKLVGQNIRTRMQEAAYRAIKPQSKILSPP